MVPTTRRRLLAVGSAAVLTGCTSDLLSSGEEPTTDRSTTRTDDGESTPETTTAGSTPETTATPAGEDLDDALAEALAPIPRSVDGSPVATLRVMATTDREDAPPGRAGLGGAAEFASQVGLDPGQVDHVTLALFAEETGLISVAGSFAAGEPEIADGMPESVSTYRTDDRFLLAVEGSENPWTPGIDAAKATLNGDRAGLVSGSSVRTLLRPVDDRTTVVAHPSFPPGIESIVGLDTPEESPPDSLEGVAVGSEVVAERTIEVTFVGLFADESSVDRSALTDLTGGAYGIDGGSLSFRRDGRRLVATGRRQFEPRPSREASPDVRFRVTYDDERGEVVLVHRGEESVEAANLTVQIGDRTVPSAFSGTVEEGDRASVAAAPFVPVRVEWTDPEDEDVFDYLTREIAAPRGAFEASYDPGTDEVTITYTGERAAPTDNLRVRRHDHDAEDEEPGSRDRGRPLSEWTATLEPGESFVVGDVQYRDRVSLTATYEWERGSMSSSVMHYRASPPGRFYVVQEEGVEVVYAGESSNPADQYRVTVGGDPADTQFGDQYATLSEEDSIGVQGDPGQEVVVEWVGGSEPLEMERERIEPPLSFELVRDGETYELTYTAGTSWDASSLSIRVDDEDAGTQFADSYGTLSKGDSVGLDLDPGETVRVVWTGGDEEMTVFWGNPLHQLAFELAYDDGDATLTYEGEGRWPAEDFAIEVGGSETGAGFDGQYLTNGDSVTVDGSVGSEVVVRYTGSEGTPQVFDGTIHPPLDFSFDYDSSAEEVTITLESDASVAAGDLRVMVFGEDERTRPDGWSSAHETVTRGDSITVDVPSSMEGVVVIHEGWEFHEDFRPGEDDGDQ